LKILFFSKKNKNPRIKSCDDAYYLLMRRDAAKIVDKGCTTSTIEILQENLKPCRAAKISKTHKSGRIQ